MPNPPETRNQKCQKQHFKKKMQQKHLVVVYKNLVSWITETPGCMIHYQCISNIIAFSVVCFCQSGRHHDDVFLGWWYWKWTWISSFGRVEGHVSQDSIVGSSAFVVKKIKKKLKTMSCWRKIPFFLGDMRGATVDALLGLGVILLWASFWPLNMPEDSDGFSTEFSDATASWIWSLPKPWFHLSTLCSVFLAGSQDFF